MKHAIWGYMFIAIGLVIIAILFLVNNLTSSDEEDFYVAREVMQSAMTEATDYGTYLVSGDIVMSREKFVEIFLRRFAESVTPNKNYQVDFYQIYEYPPAATVRIRTTTGTTSVKDQGINVDVDTILSAILVVGEDKNLEVVDVTKLMGAYSASINKSGSYTVANSSDCTKSGSTKSGVKSYINLTLNDGTIGKINKITINYQNSKSTATISGNNIVKTGCSKPTSYFDGKPISNTQTFAVLLEGGNKNIIDSSKVIDTIQIEYTKNANDNTKGTYVSELKYTPDKNNKFTCIGVKKVN